MSKKNTISAKSARERMRAERERQASAQKRRDRILKIGISVAVVVVLVGVGAAVQWQRSQGDKTVPANLTKVEDSKDTGEDGGMGDPVAGPGKADAPVLVEVFEDFLCPHCGSFEQSTGDYVKDKAKVGDIRVVYYPVTLDMFEQPSEDAANAYLCAVDKGKGQEYHDLLFAQQDQRDSAQLIELAKDVDGLSSTSFNNCVRQAKYKKYLKSIDDEFGSRAQQGENIGTPAVYVNGTMVQSQTGGELGVQDLQAAVEAAKK